MSGAAKGTRLRSGSVKSMGESKGANELSRIERCVLEYLSLGDTTKTIAAKLRISERTVMLYVRHSLRLIRAQGRDELMARIKIRH